MSSTFPVSSGDAPGSASPLWLPALSARLADGPVRLAYLFGSQATGQTHPDSDVDVAVLLSAELSRTERAREQEHLAGSVMAVCKTDTAHVILLDEASPLLAWQAIRRGVLLYCAQPGERRAFELRAAREYEETEPLRRAQRVGLARRARSLRFGQRGRQDAGVPGIRAGEQEGTMQMDDGAEYEVVFARLELLENYVARLQRHAHRSRADLDTDPDLAWVVEHGLQLCIQCVTDVCHSVVAEGGLGPAGRSVEAVERLRDAGVFPVEFSETLIRMIPFRNILVHLYARVNLDRVHEALTTQLDDFGHFARYILDYLDQRPTA